jgi:hypothetical protein
MDVLADKGYHTGEQIHQCEQNGITTYVSPKEPASNNPDIFPVSDFIYNAKTVTYTCPMQSKCTTSKKNGRNIDRSEFASLMEQNAERVNQNKDYYKQRQQLAEHPWGTIKRQRGFDHVLTRGKTKVLGEVSLVFIGYNLVRCANMVDGFEKFKALIYRHMNSINSFFSLQMADFKLFSRFNEFQLHFSAIKI